MAAHQSLSSELIDFGWPGEAPVESKITVTVLVKTACLEVVRLVVPAGKDMANHTAPGDITVQCVKGTIDFTAGDRNYRLTAGRLLYLSAGTLHALHGVEDAAVLVTIVRCDRGGRDAG
jgi:quercetin dioxygenase-like cupin family protein